MKAKAPKGLYRKFERHIRGCETPAYLIAKEAKISPTQLFFILKGERPLTQENRANLNLTLKTDF